MPPKAKFTEDEIVKAAFELVKRQGIKDLTVRTLANELGCSTCPIFTVFEGIEQIKERVIKKANDLYNTYIYSEMSSGEYPPYKASGMGYIRFAKQEKELFKMLFMCDRSGENISDGREELHPILSVIMKNLNISEDEAYRFHLEIWIYVHGLATMIATSYLDWDMEFVSSSLTNVYNALKDKTLKEKMS